LVRVAVLLDDAPRFVEPGRAKKARDVEPIGQPIEANWEVPRELVGGVLREIGVGLL
jgi:hypothetical protein